MTVSDIEPRAVLLEAVIAAITRDGLGARSLRDLAREAGTSHRMLIHHFGSRDGLLVAIVTEVEARQRELLRTLPTDTDTDDTIASVWTWVADPSLWPFERLFFECYVVEPKAKNRSIASFPRSSTTGSRSFPRGRRRDQARLGLAVIRGLLLDLVATEDPQGVRRAMKEFNHLVRDAAKPTLRK